MHRAIGVLHTSRLTRVGHLPLDRSLAIASAPCSPRRKTPLDRTEDMECANGIGAPVRSRHRSVEFPSHRALMMAMQPPAPILLLPRSSSRSDEVPERALAMEVAPSSPIIAPPARFRMDRASIELPPPASIQLDTSSAPSSPHPPQKSLLRFAGAAERASSSTPGQGVEV